MNPYFYWNGADQQFPLRDQPLEPPDCWGEKPEKPYEEEYDKEEELWRSRSQLN